MTRIPRASPPVSALSVDWFVRALGVLLCALALRFVAKGWVATLLVVPQRLHYPQLAWIPHPGRAGVLVLWAVVALSGLLMAWQGRRSAALWTAWLSFSWLEFLEVSTYLNHYYLVSVLLLLLALLAKAGTGSPPNMLPGWALNALRLQIGLVYAYAGIAKLNADWLLAAEPLRTWLFARAELPLIGPALRAPVTAFALSWLGVGYDLLIWPALCWRRTRRLALGCAVAFHVFTAVLFQIGLFPWIMVLATTLFLAPDWPRGFLAEKGASVAGGRQFGVDRGFAVRRVGVMLVLSFQLLFPLRQWLYPGNRLWTEQGFRFAWNVMLVEKVGSMSFELVGPAGAPRVRESGRRLLTPLQYKSASTQPDLVLQVAHLLGSAYERRHGATPQVFGDVWVSLNGRPRQRLVDDKVDLFAESPGLRPKRWILPLRR